MPQSPLAFTALNSAGATKPGRVDAQGALWQSSRHGRGYAASSQGIVGIAANPTGVTLSAALATTYVGICLSNPASSGKNLVVQNVAGALIVAPAALTVLSLIIGYASAGIVTHTTPLTPVNALVGTSAATLSGLVDSACTLVGTPAYAGQLALTSSATGPAFFNADIGGSIILPPGGYVAVGSNIAGPASGFVGSFQWEELAV